VSEHGQNSQLSSKSESPEQPVIIVAYFFIWDREPVVSAECTATPILDADTGESNANAKHGDAANDRRERATKHLAGRKRQGDFCSRNIM
jgi:hypothetical protein